MLVRALIIIAAQACALSPAVRRRALLQGLAGAAATTLPTQPAAAARTGLLDVDVPLELDWRSRPPLPAMARQNLDQQFAVCLMRTSYNVVDALDFVPMDEFQKRQYLTRQDEWERFLAESRKAFGTAPEQGNLADPQYFDFISFVQYPRRCRRHGRREKIRNSGAREGTRRSTTSSSARCRPSRSS